MKKTVLIATILASTIGLTACDIGKSDAWHVGYCTGGKLDSQGMNEIPTTFVAMSIMAVSAKTGLKAEDIATGYADYRKNPGGDYSKSCKIAREIDAGIR